MNSIRVQIHLKYFFDENSSKLFHNFWYVFQPSNLLTIKDIIEDIRLNYLKNQISLLTEEYDERAMIVHLDDCQLLPFTSSQILRDNDRLILMPLTKYKLHRKSLQDSINLNLSSSIITVEPPPSQTTITTTISENNHKRQRVESIEQNIPLKSTITITAVPEPVEEQPRKKKTKTKPNDDQIIQPPITQSIPEISKEPIIEKEIPSDQPLSLPSTNGRIRELKSKTPTWKAQLPAAKGNAKDKIHIRFDSDSDNEESESSTKPITAEKKSPEPVVQTKTIAEEKKTPESLPHVNGSNQSVRIQYVPTPTSTDPVKKLEESPITKKKTVDLLFEIKQHKTPDEKIGKKIQQQFGKKRAQHRKRALDYFSMANFVDKAFGLDKNDLEKNISSNGYQTSSSSTPQTLPTSFNKIARLPLVAEVIDDNDKIYDLYPPITVCPPIQTRIAFKLLELSEDFCPKMSQFKEGTVIDVNQTSNELTIELDKPLQTVFNQPSKFYAPTDEISTEENLNTMTLSFSDLNSVRLVSTSNGNPTT